MSPKATPRLDRRRLNWPLLAVLTFDVLAWCAIVAALHRIVGP